MLGGEKAFGFSPEATLSKIFKSVTESICHGVNME